ncbi:MAG: hypothetical protein DMD91_04495 [Candidatus Rokuibacteriota bacterium]|nr:MAG: hypothetical protein DMD91_04495 [Candidatus Rokubacteria bacterium]
MPKLIEHRLDHGRSSFGRKDVEIIPGHDLPATEPDGVEAESQVAVLHPTQRRQTKQTAVVRTDGDHERRRVRSDVPAPGQIPGRRAEESIAEIVLGQKVPVVPQCSHHVGVDEQVGAQSLGEAPLRRRRAFAPAHWGHSATLGSKPGAGNIPFDRGSYAGR